MSQQDILAGLAAIVNEVAGIPAESVAMDKSFVDDLDVDSLSMVEVVMACEDKFGVTIPDTEVKNLVTVGDAVPGPVPAVHPGPRREARQRRRLRDRTGRVARDDPARRRAALQRPQSFLHAELIAGIRLKVGHAEVASVPPVAFGVRVR